jgi:uncharacterized radical SAM protein YgiQ
MSELTPEFMPMSTGEMVKLGWDELDILIVTGDAYVDHPSYGIALIGRILLAEGYRVGIVAQPAWDSPDDLLKLGRPRLACLVSSGNMDSMVNIFTAARRKRISDVYSVNGEIGKRPSHALTVYCQLAKRAFRGLPIIIGGIESSLRRVAHYDYWQDKLRQSVIVGCKADIAVFGQGESPILNIIKNIVNGESLAGIPGTFRLLGKNAAAEFKPDEHYMRLPSWSEMQADKDCLMASTKLVEQQMNPWGGKGLYQAYGEQLVVIEPSPEPLTTAELDRVHELPFSCMPHPVYKGPIPAFETIKHSIPAVRGCPGGCAFCGLVSHQGRMVSSRSHESVIKDVMRMKQRPNFRGTISDIGGAAGNIYDSQTQDVEKCKKCRRSSCLFPKICPNYVCDGKSLVKLLREVRSIPGVKHLHINSGIRLDLAVQQKELSRELIQYHVSGHMKVAPEHLHPDVVRMMRKNSAEDFYKFMVMFEEESRAVGKEQYLIPLFISNFPGCTEREMKTVDDFLNRNNWSPQQVQDYIPLPMTMGAAMYYTGKDADGNTIQVNRGLKERRPQINALKRHRSRDYGKRNSRQQNNRRRR